MREREAEEGNARVVASSPSKIQRLYPPQYAGVQSIEAHGDEEMDDGFRWIDPHGPHRGAALCQR